MMTLTYPIDNSLYVNLTNRCTNSCDFCIRNNGDGAYGSDSLWLEREPTAKEVLDDILSHDLTKLDELVFCGYGEPLMRLDELVWISKQVKAVRSDLPVRVNTNGQAELIWHKGVASKLEWAVDTVSISLNEKNAALYQKTCHSKYGEAAYVSILSFAKDCTNYVPHVVLTVVDVIPPEDIEQCRKIAAEIGVELRVREFIS